MDSEERNFYDDKPSSPCLFGGKKKNLFSKGRAAKHTRGVDCSHEVPTSLGTATV